MSSEESTVASNVSYQYTITTFYYLNTSIIMKPCDPEQGVGNTIRPPQTWTFPWKMSEALTLASKFVALIISSTNHVWPVLWCHFKTKHGHALYVCIFCREYDKIRNLNLPVHNMNNYMIFFNWQLYLFGITMLMYVSID